MLGNFDLNSADFGLQSWSIGSVDIRFVIFLGIFLGALLSFEGIRQLLSRRETVEEAKSRRMRLVNSGASPEEILSALKPPETSGIVSSLPLIGDTQKTLNQAGLTISAEIFWVVAAIGSIFSVVLTAQVLSLPIAILLTFALFFIMPTLIIKNMKIRRMNRLTGQLPDALELMARGLRVGHPLNTTLASVAREMPDPIGSEFGIVVDQVAYGDDLSNAIVELASRVDQEDVHYFAVSVSIQHGTGGDLATILDTLARVIRDRAAMRQKIRAISAESRMSAIFLSAIPVVIFAFMSVAVPSYFNDVKGDPMYLPMMILIGTFIGANALILRKLVRFRF